MQLPIVMYGHPILRKKSKPVVFPDASLPKLIQDMKETLLSKNGLGLSAPQIGQNILLFITNIPENEDDFQTKKENFRVFINPKIISRGDTEWVHDEGCLSIPRIYAPVLRPETIVIHAQDENGNHFEETLTEWPARVFCHENDHLNGVLFIDRIPQKEKTRIEPILKRIKDQCKGYNEQFRQA